MHYVTGIPICTYILLHIYLYFYIVGIISGERIFLGKPWYCGATYLLFLCVNLLVAV